MNDSCRACRIPAQFDTVSELHKVAEMDPEFKLVLRIRADDPGARVPLGLKYGAEVSEAPGLLRAARELGLECCGVSFHVGSAAKNLATFTNAIENARKVGPGDSGAYWLREGWLELNEFTVLP